jgi:hypothetical protein
MTPNVWKRENHFIPLSLVFEPDPAGPAPVAARKPRTECSAANHPVAF